MLLYILCFNSPIARNIYKLYIVLIQMTQTDETKRLLISTTEKEREQINAVLEKARQKNEKEKEEYEQLQLLRQTEENARRTLELEVLELKKKEQSVIDNYKLPIEYLKSIARGYNKAFIFLGSCGIGKSFITRQTLTKEGVEFVESRGVNSPLGFYQFLYENNHKDTILVLDDIAGLLENSNAYSILLGVLWEGIASWNSTSGKLKIPKQFIFNGRIIIIANKLKGELKEFFEMSNADIVKSRCLTFNLKMTQEEIIKMMYCIAKQKHNHLTEYERLNIVRVLGISGFLSFFLLLLSSWLFVV